MAKVRLVDETTSGERRDAWALEWPEARLTLREVIRRRVFEEVAALDAARAEGGQGLVKPTETERLLNGNGTGTDQREARHTLPQKHYERALADFGRNGFLVLVGDRQIWDLDEEVDLTAGAEITFLKLVPLVGG
ncbi:hypothetical protein J1792_09185 [Streptomyces triculaminicus]|uniref:Uncharacterized protein n=2 Tax=Streptomyces TaxID=1883 RepID=A0A939FN26_9ACTN|nr:MULTISPECIES: hypothetical protein [Streptomyces]MBO0652957.1 hypothetical protein [Streptomyces triculaminicus]QSY51450.1 hypothetical protein J3S04_11595 [Streptomyces griseocarneus]